MKSCAESARGLVIGRGEEEMRVVEKNDGWWNGSCSGDVMCKRGVEIGRVRQKERGREVNESSFGKMGCACNRGEVRGWSEEEVWGRKRN